MARHVNKRDFGPILAAAQTWIKGSLIADGSMFSSETLWTAPLVGEVRHAFVDHPDFGQDDFMTKLKGQMGPASAQAQKLMSEMLWALLLFPSNMKARTKRQQIGDIWSLSGSKLSENIPLLSDQVLVGIGSGGPGFNNYRPDELEYLVVLVGDLKSRPSAEREKIFAEYDAFVAWIDAVPRKGSRQFRHMLRYFAFPDRVERISSNNDRRRILEAFGKMPTKQTKNWSDQQLDDSLLELRGTLEKSTGLSVIDFYEPPLRERWLNAAKVVTPKGDTTVIVPDDEDEEEAAKPGEVPPEQRESIKIQAKLSTIGATMGLSIWLPASDRARVASLVSADVREVFLEKLPLNYDQNTLGTISQIDVLWIKKQSIVRAFEVEHTTAVYSGLLRMADLLALQPNMKIHLHIVAPDERRDKVFREMQRPVFTYLDAGPLAQTCTFLSYDSVSAISQLGSLAHMQHSVLDDYEERADESEA